MGEDVSPQLLLVDDEAALREPLAVRWWVNFGLIILAVLLIAGLLVLSRHSWFPDQVQRHA